MKPSTLRRHTETITNAEASSPPPPATATLCAMLDHVYAGLSLKDFVGAAANASNKDGALKFNNKSLRTSLWRQRAVNFFTFRPFVGRKWESSKLQAVYNAFQKALNASFSERREDVKTALTSSFVNSSSVISRRKVENVLLHLDPQGTSGVLKPGEHKVIAQLKKEGFKNPTYTFYEPQNHAATPADKPQQKP